MIDDLDASASTLRLLVSDALKKWESDALIKLLDEDDIIVRTAAARELQTRGGEEIFKRILPLVSSKKSACREIVAFVLGQLGTPDMPMKEQSIPFLLSLAKDKNSEVRSAAAAAFGHLCFNGMPAAVEKKLIELCSDNDKDVRACAAYALGNSSGSKEVRTLLNELLSQEYVCEYAELGLDLLDTK